MRVLRHAFTSVELEGPGVCRSFLKDSYEVRIADVPRSIRIP